MPFGEPTLNSKNFLELRICRVPISSFTLGMWPKWAPTVSWVTSMNGSLERGKGELLPPRRPNISFGAGLGRFGGSKYRTGPEGCLGKSIKIGGFSIAMLV